MQEMNANILACLEKAIAVLPKNLNDDSRYFMAEWDAASATLSFVVTDDTKTKDSLDITEVCLSKVNPNIAMDSDEFAENLRNSIHNYLTTSREFMQYSLIAVFYSGSRDNTKLI